MSTKDTDTEVTVFTPRTMTRYDRAVLAAINVYRERSPLNLGRQPNYTVAHEDKPMAGWDSVDKINIRDSAWMLINDVVKFLAGLGEGATDRDHLIRLIDDALAGRDG